MKIEISEKEFTYTDESGGRTTWKRDISHVVGIHVVNEILIVVHRIWNGEITSIKPDNTITTTNILPDKISNLQSILRDMLDKTENSSLKITIEY